MFKRWYKIMCQLDVDGYDRYVEHMYGTKREAQDRIAILNYLGELGDNFYYVKSKQPELNKDNK